VGDVIMVVGLRILDQGHRAVSTNAKR